MLADWPGLSKRERFENRDLRITSKLRTVLRGVLADHLQVATRSLNADVFPGSENIKGLALFKA